MHTYYTALLASVLLSSLLSAQSYSGLVVDNYAGTHSLLLNPANVADSRTAFEIHLGSVSALVGSDYAELDGSRVRDALDTDADQAILSRDLRDDNFGFGSVDVLGPSLFMSLSPNTGLGILTRARGMYTVANINGGLFEGLQSDFDAFPDFPVEQTDARSTLHLWGEASVVLGTVLLRTDHSVLKGGAAVKYLQGLGAVYTRNEQLMGSYDRTNSRITLNGDMTFGRAGDLDLEAIEPGNRSTAFGFDLGLSYEWRPGSVRDTSRLRAPYRVRAAVSLMDMGGIGYDAGYRTDYLLSGGLPVATIEDADGTEALLAANFDGATTEESVTVGLPTTLHALLDLRVGGAFYVSALYSSFSEDEERLAPSLPTTLTLAPRIDAKVLGLSLPITFREGQPTSVGAGLRFGPLVVGSSTIVSHTFLGGAYAADVYLGLKWPFQRRIRRRSTNRNPI